MSSRAGSALVGGILFFLCPKGPLEAVSHSEEFRTQAIPALLAAAFRKHPSSSPDVEIARQASALSRYHGTYPLTYEEKHRVTLPKDILKKLPSGPLTIRLEIVDRERHGIRLHFDPSRAKDLPYTFDSSIDSDGRVVIREDLRAALLGKHQYPFVLINTGSFFEMWPLSYVQSLPEIAPPSSANNAYLFTGTYGRQFDRDRMRPSADHLKKLPKEMFLIASNKSLYLLPESEWRLMAKMYDNPKTPAEQALALSFRARSFSVSLDKQERILIPRGALLLAQFDREVASLRLTGRGSYIEIEPPLFPAKLSLPLPDKSDATFTLETYGDVYIYSSKDHKTAFSFYRTSHALVWRSVEVDPNAEPGVATAVGQWLLAQAVAQFPEQDYPLEINSVSNPVILRVAERLFDLKSLQIRSEENDPWTPVNEVDVYQRYGPLRMPNTPLPVPADRAIVIEKKNSRYRATHAPEGVEISFHGPVISIRDNAGHYRDYLFSDTFDLRGRPLLRPTHQKVPAPSVIQSGA